MKFRYLIVLLGFWINTAWTDFSGSTITSHPFYPHDGPFVLEIKGDWPNDCHPGEQQPVVRAYDGGSALIEFKTVVVHITCNPVPTPYRVLVDMSDVVGSVDGSFDQLDVTVRFGGAETTRTLLLSCPEDAACPSSPATTVWPEHGLFENSSLHSQGLLIDRQNSAVAAYPLIYDENGDSKWLIAGGRVVEDVFFAELFELTGGQCLGCPLPPQPPNVMPVGSLTLLVDRPGTLQARINHGPFEEYQSLVFGYQTFRVGTSGQHSLTDLEGRWGISENRGSVPHLGDLTDYLPGAFDLVRENIVNAGGDVLPDGQESYLVFTPTGGELGQLVCAGKTAADGSATFCEFIDATDAAEPLFRFYQDGPSSLSIEFARLAITVGIPPGGKAVRLD